MESGDARTQTRFVVSYLSVSRRSRKNHAQGLPFAAHLFFDAAAPDVTHNLLTHHLLRQPLSDDVGKIQLLQKAKSC
jgi:hypothetical protein